MFRALGIKPPLSVLYYSSNNSTTAGEGVEDVETSPEMERHRVTFHVMNSTRQLCNVCSLEGQVTRDEIGVT